MQASRCRHGERAGHRRSLSQRCQFHRFWCRRWRWIGQSSQKPIIASVWNSAGQVGKVNAAFSMRKMLSMSSTMSMFSRIMDLKVLWFLVHSAWAYDICQFVIRSKRNKLFKSALPDWSKNYSQVETQCWIERTSIFPLSIFHKECIFIPQLLLAWL